jgi:hypothetical protein
MKSKNKKMNVEKGPSYSFDATTKNKMEAFIRLLKTKGGIDNEASGKKEEE